MTAVALLESLAPYRPTVEGDELVVELDPPAALLGRLETLHTGVRAVLSGRKWEGGAVSTGGRPVVVGLDPAKPIAPSVTLLRVEGDSSWDRFPASARSGTPELFDQTTEPGPTRLNDPKPAWDLAAAVALMTATDSLVERLGVSGSDPVVQSAAVRVLDAYQSREMCRVQAAVQAFEDEICRLARRVRV
jgi:hypothetical protein